MLCCLHLTVQAQHHEHGEEEDGPQRRHWQLSDSLGISQKRQTRT